jgi:excinuclease ABC subunit C
MNFITNLKDKLKNIPKTPGVYFWLDDKGKPLYIGRATSLKQRLSQYFQKRIDSRIAEMVTLARDLKWQSTDTVLESIILEANLIKKHWPKYNVKDKDNRSFVYIVISSGDYPRPIIIRGQDLKKFPEQKFKIFGPYQTYTLIQNALRIIRRVFPYSNCQPLSGKACFDYQIGLCPGTCLGMISSQEYQKNIKNICLLLAGEKKRLLQNLIKENPDKIRALEHIQEVSLLTRDNDLSSPQLNRIEGYDISHLTGRETYASMVVVSNGQIDKKEYRLFKIKKAPAGDDERALQEALWRRFEHQDWPRPDLLMIDGGKPQIDFVFKILEEKNIRVPIVGISKLGGDKLVFSRGVTSDFKKLAASIKITLLQVREEAHRFAVKAGRKARSFKSVLRNNTSFKK